MTTTGLSTSGKIRLWDRLEIIVGDGPDAGRYLTRLEDFGQGVLVVGVPEYVAGSDLLTNGAPCHVIFTREDAVYRFDSVIALFERKGRRTYLLRAPEHINRVQRRQFVRLNLRRPLTITPLNLAIESSTAQTLTAHPTVSVNVSGGGMLIQTPVELRLGDLLLVDVDFFPTIGVPSPLAAVVRRVDKLSDRTYAGIEFIRTEHIETFFGPEAPALLPGSIRCFDQMMQNKLVNYVFAEQVKLRQKGLL